MIDMDFLNQKSELATKAEQLVNTDRFEVE